MIQPRPGDVLLVGRRLTARSWLTAPLRTALAWRIQRAGRSIWNHVACVVSDTEVVEAVYDRGVVTKGISNYDSRFLLDVARMPDEIDIEKAVVFWRGQIGQTYSTRSLVLLQLAGLIYGHERLGDHVRLESDDGAWICSELAAAGWEAGGYAGARQAFLTPWDFAKLRNPPA